MRSLAPLRTSLLAALGLAGVTACGGSVNVEDGGEGGGENTTVGQGPSASASGSGGGTSGSGVTTVGTTTGAGGSGGASGCLDPQAVPQPNGTNSGYVECSDGSINRATVGACENNVPVGTACVGDEMFLGCDEDADCTEGVNGRCLQGGNGFEGTSCGCQYGCTTDADCGEGTVCACGGLNVGLAYSRCVPAGCTENADCAGGECGLSTYDDGCGRQVVQSCRTDADACRESSTCANVPGECSPAWVGEAYGCQTPNCAIGRPMTIDGVAVAGGMQRRADWNGSVGAGVAAPFSLGQVDVASLSPAVRRAAAQRWREIAALEHASVGSFARFTLQLLAVGAPAELLAEAQQAALDEVEHARLAFAVASALGGEAVGPGPITGVGAAVPVDAPSIVRALVEEACVGETMGVAEALAYADAARDPALAALQRKIAADEERHAALAYRTLRWMLERDASLVAAAREGLEKARALLVVTGDDSVLDEGAGLFSTKQIAEVRRAAFTDVVLPCMAAVGVA